MLARMVSISGPCDSPASASQSAGITDMSHHTQTLFFPFLVEVGFHHVVQAGLELLILDHLSTSASQSAEITGVSHCTRQLSFAYSLIICLFPFVYFFKTILNHMILMAQS